jgi:hypothetical protein
MYQRCRCPHLLFGSAGRAALRLAEEKNVIAINTIRVYTHGNWANLLYNFPQGFIDDNRNTLACSDPANAARPATFVKGTSYYLRWLVNGTGHEDRFEGECEYEPGGAAGVQFGELELLD